MHFIYCSYLEEFCPYVAGLKSQMRGRWDGRFRGFRRSIPAERVQGVRTCVCRIFNRCIISLKFM